MKRRLQTTLLGSILSILAFSTAASESCPQPDDAVTKVEQHLLDSKLQSAIRYFQNGEYRNSISILEKYTFLDVPEAKHLLAFHYLKGLAVAPNFSKAMSLFKDVANHYRRDQSVESNYRLGEMLASSQGVLEKEAFEATLMAAKSGHSKAQYLLSNFYRDGIFVPTDLNLEKYWLECSSKNGNIEAIYEMGLKAWWNKNYDIAENYYSLAAAKGHKDAMYNYGVMILTGQAKNAESGSGLDWIIRAANGSSRQAARFLAESYTFGAYGLDKDMKLASHWRSVSQPDKLNYFLSYDLIR